MAEMSFDPEDTGIIALVVLASGVMAGRASFEAFNVALSDVTTVGGATFSIAYIVTLGAFAWTVLTNEGMSTDLSQLRKDARKELDDTYYYLLVASFGTLILWPFVPEIGNIVQSQDLWGVLFIAGSTGAQVALGYMK
jgi:hypothetical protein